MIPQHMSKTSEHYTPRVVVDAARAWMGHIELDPATCPSANETVMASRIFTQDTDARIRNWDAETIFCNPPGGVEKVPGFSSRSVACQFWEKLTMHSFRCAVFVGFTIEILRTTQCLGKFSVIEFADHLCIPSSRLRFSGTSPTHANVIVGVGQGISEFGDCFRHIGDVVNL